MFGLTNSISTIQSILGLLIFLQKMVLVVWLIVKGFDPSILTSGTAKQKEVCNC